MCGGGGAEEAKTAKEEELLKWHFLLCLEFARKPVQLKERKRGVLHPAAYPSDSFLLLMLLAIKVQSPLHFPHTRFQVVVGSLPSTGL